MRRVLAAAMLTLALGACDGSTESGSSDADRSGRTTSTTAEASNELAAKAAVITDRVIANDWPAIRKDFDVTLERALTEEMLAGAWAQTVAAHGAFVSRGEPTEVRQQAGFIVFDTPLTFERAPMKTRVSFHADGKIGGLFILKPEVP